MQRNIMLSGRLQEVLLSGQWIANTNYKAQLHNVTWQQAIQQVSNLNTIAALTYHVNYYLAGLLKSFETGELNISDKFSYQFKTISSQHDWDKLVNDILDNAEKFVLKVEQIEDKQFDLPFVDAKYGTLLRNIEGVIEHCYYHLGQIVLIKKLITTEQL